MKSLEIKNNIKKLRFEHGQMSQAELATNCGVTRQTINAIEQGKYSPSLELAFKIAQIFNVTINDVFFI